MSRAAAESLNTHMRQQMKTPIWPYIAVVACLFVLSVLAPRAWRGPESQLKPIGVDGGSSADNARPRVIRADEQFVESSPLSTQAGPEGTRENAADTVENGRSGTARTGDSSRQGLLGWNGPESPNTMTVEPAKPIQLDESLVDLDHLFLPESPSQVAPIQPPVAEQIKLDVAVPSSSPISSPPLVPPASPTTAAPEEKPAVEHGETPVSMVRQPAESSVEIASEMPLPADLVAGIRELGTDPQCGEWATHLADVLEQIHREKSLRSAKLSQLFVAAYDVLKQTPRVADKIVSLELRARVLRCGYAAKRRIDVWQQVHRIVATNAPPAPASSTGMDRCLVAVETRLRETDHSTEWRKYLLLDELKKFVGPGDPATRRTVAKRVLKRIDSNQLSEAQVAVFNKSPFQEFSQELRLWAAEPVDYLRLLQNVESYERTASAADATAIADVYDVVRWSPRTELQQLGEILNSHYRNANVRVALTADFLNRLLPDPQSFQEDINSNIAGADVSGTSHTVNRLHVVLHPDPETWQIGLEAHGEVSSDTAASKGPATFYNQGWGRYHARKLMMIDRRGIRVWRAETDANSETELTGFETDLDPIPVLGWLARSMARSQHDQQYYSAKAETEEMMRQRAGTRFDDEVHARLQTAEENVKQKLLAPFERIDLKPTPVDMSTTEQRVIARYRLAADSQLGAQTPRPQAPANSLLSVQIHESALNNTLANLKLEGRKTELRDLYREIAGVFEKSDVKIPDEIPEGVLVTFAENEAVRVRCDDSRVILTIRIAELKNGRSKWRDFTVRASYIPDAQQLNANLVREETLEIFGEKLGIRERPPLRVIFSKVLSKSRAFNLVNKRLSENPHLDDCHVSQFVINDGWVGIGIGPQRAQSVEQMARQPKAEVR